MKLLNEKELLAELQKDSVENLLYTLFTETTNKISSERISEFDLGKTTLFLELLKRCSNAKRPVDVTENNVNPF
ncbi:MAG: hypothetical protein LBV51_00005 [Acholeplasmatales bacterium]|nr:hypothetical protein [Acholeplasmatales bacterium]